MKVRLPAALLLAIVPLLSASVFASTRVDAAKNGKPPVRALSTQVSGTFSGSASGLKGPGTFKGTMRVRHFVASNRKLVAQVTLTGTLRDANGKSKQVNQSQSIPVRNLTQGGSRMLLESANNGHTFAGSCNILTLDLGPLHLNLLGLVVNLSPIHLTITGQTGPGNLLGNLLCGIANLGNGGLSNLQQILLNDIALLLNQIIGVLQGL